MQNIFDDVLEDMDPVIKEHYAYITAPKFWPAVVGYKPWVRSVLTNYIDNAIKYGGTVGVSSIEEKGSGFFFTLPTPLEVDTTIPPAKPPIAAQ